MSTRTRSISRTIAVADLFGRPRVITAIESADGYHFAAVDMAEPEAASDDSATCDIDHKSTHYLTILLDAARPLLTEKQIEAVEQVIVLNRSLHDLSRERGGSVEAWRQRIEGKRGRGGIRLKAPELYAIWAFRQRARRDIASVIDVITRACKAAQVRPKSRGQS